MMLLTEPIAPPAETADEPAGRQRAALAAATLAFAALAVIGAVGYRGFIEGDATNHYLIARFAIDRPSNLAGVWGRPFCTLLYVLPAQAGHWAKHPNIWAGVWATRGVSLVLALLVAWITYRIAKLQKLRWPMLAAVFVYAQPIFFVHSFSEMTEIPFALLLGAAYWAYARGQWLVMAILAGLLPLARPEGFGLIFLAAAALLAHRRVHWLIVPAIPFLIWNYAGWWLTHPAVGEPSTPWYLWVRANWPYSATSAYGRGALWDLPMRLPLVAGILVFPFTCIGIALGLRRHPLGRGGDRPHLAFWNAAIPLLILAGHTILWWRGWMGSNGAARYLVICTPMWALLTASGWEWAMARRPIRYSHAIAAACSILPLPITFTGISYPNLPIGPVAADRISQHIAQWWRNNPDIRRRYPRILSSLPALSFNLDLDLNLPQHWAESGKSGIRKGTPGTLLIWDPILGATNADQNLCLTLDEIRAAGWVHIRKVDNRDVGGRERAEIFLSPTDIDGQSSLPLSDEAGVRR